MENLLKHISFSSRVNFIENISHSELVIVLYYVHLHADHLYEMYVVYMLTIVQKGDVLISPLRSLFE